MLPVEVFPAEILGRVGQVRAFNAQLAGLKLLEQQFITAETEVQIKKRLVLAIGLFERRVAGPEADADGAEPADDVKLAVDVPQNGLEVRFDAGEVFPEELLGGFRVSALKLPHKDGNQGRVFLGRGLGRGREGSRG